MKTISKDREKLLSWYHAHKRDLPWRKTKNPYPIWISEVMLQQTTVAAVIPYYERFLNKFPQIEDLAQSSIEDIYESWAGLGYYSRARNLHKAAKEIYYELKTFPKTYQQLILLPGFGPYTSRAVASLAFNQPVGVLDGNVIRVLTRKYGIDCNWWEPHSREQLQTLADSLSSTENAADTNQALMELGATICTPKKVLCVMCPWSNNCVSYKDNKISARPKPKPKQKFQIWSWHFDLYLKKSSGEDQIFLTENLAAPFLKKSLLPPSAAKQLKQKPKLYKFKHGVTKFDIYVHLNIKNLTPKSAGLKSGKWYPIQNIQKINPTSLMKKITSFIESDQRKIKK